MAQLSIVPTNDPVFETEIALRRAAELSIVAPIFEINYEGF